MEQQDHQEVVEKMVSRDNQGKQDQGVLQVLEVTLVHRVHPDCLESAAVQEILATQVSSDNLVVQGLSAFLESKVQLEFLDLLEVRDIQDQLEGRAVQVYQARLAGMVIQETLVHVDR